jgi:RHS repeat-associated protein
MAGVVQSAVELDPFGADTARGSNASFQPKRFTSYDRDANQSDEAMHRRFNRWHSRFDQPDPVDSSYDLADPQSLNRYAYVQNDPVNFVDPSGLNLESMTCYTYGHFTRWDFSDGRSVTILNSTTTRCYGGGGSGGGGGGDIAGGGAAPGQDDNKPLPFESCDQFVSFLLDLATEAVKDLPEKGVIHAPEAGALGKRMMSLAFFGYERHISNGYAGFKPELVANGQNGGVYGHILGIGGAYLAGPIGWVAGASSDLFDNVQKLWGTQQGAAEVKGNEAGLKVGHLIERFIHNGSTPRDRDRLSNNIRAELCK